MSKLDKAVKAAVSILRDAVETSPQTGKKTSLVRDMRCKHVGRDGKRCRSRSKGPRFRYLCDQHREDTSPVKRRGGIKKKPPVEVPANGVQSESTVGGSGGPIQ